MVHNLLNLKQKTLKLIQFHNVSKDFSADNMKKAALNWYFYDFSVDYDAIAVDYVLDIHKNLMKKNVIV